MWTYIVFCIFIFLLGIAVGIMIDSAEVNATYAQALDDAYNTGYRQGAEEEQKKHIDWLDKN